MNISEKLIVIAENEKKIYIKGGLDASPKETVMGEIIKITDIAPFEHYLRVVVGGVEDLSVVKLYKTGKNLLSVGIVNGNFTTTGLNTVNKSSISTYGFFLKRGTYTVSGMENGYKLFINGMKSINKTSDYQVLYDLKRTFKIPSDGLYNLQFNKPSAEETVDIATLNLQVETGDFATEYEPYIEPTLYDVSADGTVEVVEALYPSTTLYTDTSGTEIECTYYQDGKKVKENLIGMVAEINSVL